MKSVFIDIVSDIVCPWCAVGYHRLKRAADNLGVNLAINWHPFELNPNMPSEGEDLYDHFHKKYGMTTEKTDALGDALKRYGALLDFEFNYPQGNRMRNTFRAHQLLAWARTFGAGTRAYEALFTAYFSDQRDIGATEVLLDIVDALNLDRDAAEAILSRGVLAESVKEIAQVAGTGHPRCSSGDLPRPSLGQRRAARRALRTTHPPSIDGRSRGTGLSALYSSASARPARRPWQPENFPPQGRALPVA